jgi:two-component system sensor histidine kinase ArlS
MLSDKLHFTKTLKFKLTFWYSLLLSVFSILFVLSVNLWLDSYMKTNIATVNRGYWGRVIEERPMYRNLTDEQIDLITEARLADLNTIKSVTLYSIVPLVFLSFLGGYGIASFSLKPLEDLSKKMKEKSTENLGEEIQFIDNQDEISELIKSFNRMSRRLNKSFEAQKEFVENASHELKTPLSVIQANLDTALDDGDISKKELKKLLDSSKENVKFMNKLTEDLLLLSVLEHEVESEEVELKSLFLELTKEASRMVDSQNIEIDFNDKGKEFIVKGNEVLYKRAFMNILENAIKYSDASKIEIGLEKEKKSVKVIIEDNGKGISKEHLDKIFDRFYRVDKSRSRKTGGSGLGLSIAKKIIESYGGNIKVESKKGNGTKFVITFYKS